jgi:hypothetical protein
MVHGEEAPLGPFYRVCPGMSRSVTVGPEQLQVGEASTDEKYEVWTVVLF